MFLLLPMFLSCLSPVIPSDAAPPAAPVSGFIEAHCGRALLGVTAQENNVYWLLEQSEAGWNGNRDAEREEAVARARDQAVAALQQKICAGRSPEDCAALQPHITTRHYNDPKQRLACAISGIHSDQLQRNTALVAAEAALKPLLKTILDALGPAPLVVEPIRTAEGCAVPSLDWVQIWLRGSLHVPQHRPDEQQPGDQRLLLDAATTGDGLVISAALQQSGPRAPLGTALLARSAWTVPPDGVCLSDRRFNVQDANPLSLSVSYDAPGSRFCKGAIFPIHIRTAAPARVHLYSVAPDGSSYHLWPEPGTSPDSAGDITVDGLAWPTSGGDEKLVAVALPPGTTSPLDRAAGLCRLPAPLDRQIPPGATVRTTTWSVAPGCTENADLLPRFEAALQNVPACTP